MCLCVVGKFRARRVMNRLRETDRERMRRREEWISISLACHGGFL